MLDQQKSSHRNGRPSYPIKFSGIKLQTFNMKYLLLSVLLCGYNAGAQVPDSTWRTDTIKRVWVHGPHTETIKFKSYAERQAFYRNLGHTITGFDSSMLCKHIYVAVIEPDVKVKETEPTNTLAIMPRLMTGKHEGQDIVCVKCFHIRKQVFDYGDK